MTKDNSEALIDDVWAQAMMCIWTIDKDGIYHTSCNHSFYFDGDGGPRENQFKYCCYCGNRLVEVKI